MIKIQRDGEPALLIDGDKIGSGSTQTVRGSGQNRWSEVDIYKSRAGKYVVHIQYKTQWEGERCMSRALVCDNAASVIETLRNDDGDLSDASQEAIEAAAKTEPAFNDAWTEKVD